ncbi:hypothetical protein TNCV_3274231 [Trichonephila clavipes]|nr:hypothetical protein TNCV_3274231 [Trichonephila clavipes]
MDSNSLDMSVMIRYLDHLAAAALMRTCDFRIQKINWLQPGSYLQSYAYEAVKLPLSHKDLLFVNTKIF